MLSALEIASVAVPLTGIYPAVTVALAALFLGETITLKTGIGITFAIMAALLLA